MSIVPGLPQLSTPAIAELAKLRQWVGFRQSDKAPLSFRGGMAESTSPSTWCDYATACRMAAMHDPCPADGVGFVFSQDDEYTGIDLDHCGNADRGHLMPWAKAIVDRFPTFTEISLSGKGLHLFVRGKVPRSCQLNNNDDVHRPKGGIYPVKRYFAMTGKNFGNVEEIMPAEGRLMELLEEWESIRGGPPGRTVQWTNRAIAPEFPFQKFEALKENLPEFKANWSHRWSQGDISMSGFDRRLAMIAYRASWTEEELAGLIIEHRKAWAGKMGKPAKEDLEKVERRHDYILRTIDLAKSGADDCMRSGVSLREAEARATAREAADNAIEEGTAIKELRDRLGIPLQRVIITGVERAINYWLQLDTDARVCLGEAKDLLTQKHVRAELLSTTDVVMNSVKQLEWDSIVRMLVAVAEREDAADSDPVKGLLSAIDEHAEEQNRATPSWDTDEADACFRSGGPIKRGKLLGITVRGFLRWCDGRGVLRGMREEDIRGRLRMAGWKGEKMSRRVDGAVCRRYYWWGETLNIFSCDTECYEKQEPKQ